MAIYKISDGRLATIDRTTFESQGIKERQDLQQMLKAQIDVICPETLIVAEEFSDWDGSRRSIDLLGIDKQANLIVIELKRSEHGDHMELQALRYAAMISAMTYERLVAVFESYIESNDLKIDASDTLLDFLDWAEPDEEQFAQEVKIVLASAEFSKELTTSVTWLNDSYGLNIRCVRMQPYQDGVDTLIDVQTIIPLPEVADYQIKISQKKQKERVARTSSRDFTKFDVSINGAVYPALSKRAVMFRVVQGIIQAGSNPHKIQEALPWRKNRLFKEFEGELSGDDVKNRLRAEDPGGTVPLEKRFFVEDDEIFVMAGRTFALSNQWGSDQFFDSVKALTDKSPHVEISITEST